MNPRNSQVFLILWSQIMSNNTACIIQVYDYSRFHMESKYSVKFITYDRFLNIGKLESFKQILNFNARMKASIKVPIYVRRVLHQCKQFVTHNDA